MRIPSGDLAPARKRRRGYGGRRKRRGGRSSLAPLLVALLVLAVAGGAAYAVQRYHRSSSTVAAGPSASPCPAPKAAPAAPVKVAPLRLPAPAQVQLRLLNGSSRSLLAKTIGDQLAARGFHVVKMGNAPKPLTGASRVYFGPGARPAGTLLAAQVLDAELVPVGTAKAGSVDVVLGSAFARLRTPAEAAVTAHTLAAGTVAASPKPAPAPRPSC